MCINMGEANMRCENSKRHVPDVPSVLDELADSPIASLIDLKGAFHNIPIRALDQRFFGFITQDGLYVFERMPFGHTNAPTWLQGVLEQIIHEDGRKSVATFYDDITPHGSDQEAVWETTLGVVAKLHKYGFMINLNKSEFLVQTFKLLGFIVGGGGYQLGPKAMSKLFEVGIPQSYKQVRELLGKLNFASRLVPNFKKLVRPIEKLLSGNEGVWDEQCTANLNELYRVIYARLKLQIYQPKLPLKFYYSHDADYCEVVVTQPFEEGESPIALLSRELTPTE